MEKLMNYMERNAKAMILSLSISVGILLLLVMVLFFNAVKQNSEMKQAKTDMMLVIRIFNDNAVKHGTEIENMKKELDEFTGMNDLKRVQYLKLKQAADSAVINYFRADIKGLESMSKLLQKDSKRLK